MIIKAEEILEDEKDRNEFKDIYCEVQLQVNMISKNKNNDDRVEVGPKLVFPEDETEKLRKIIIKNFKNELRTTMLKHS